MKRVKFTNFLLRPCGGVVNKGMTLIEIMIVVALIGTLMTILVRSLTGQRDKTMIQACRIAEEQIGQSLDMYKIAFYKYPTTDQGLEALVTEPSGVDAKKWAGPYLEKKKMNDPWGNKFQYESDGKTYKITSSGPGGVQGAADSIVYPDDEESGSTGGGSQPASSGDSGGGGGN